MIIDLTIIIVNYKSWEKLNIVFKKYSKSKTNNIQIIVVDNFSNDNKLKYFQKNKEVNGLKAKII